MNDAGTGDDDHHHRSNRASHFSEMFAELMTNYQQNHSELLAALADDSVSIEAFDKLSEMLHREAVALKRMKMGVAELRKRESEERDE